VKRPRGRGTKRVAREEGDDRRDELEREDEADQHHPDLVLLVQRNPADRRARQQQHPDPEREEAERQAAADRAKHDARLSAMVLRGDGDSVPRRRAVKPD
jgi:hypothetical protein